mmetsp:Transcript_46490/g.99641  ORF Transcript_46490/g.99641 Transcript_46490/m.99641 type:complete len:203 (+) Transcript_46490:321-929(+)
MGVIPPALQIAILKDHTIVPRPCRQLLGHSVVAKQHGWQRGVGHHLGDLRTQANLPYAVGPNAVHQAGCSVETTVNLAQSNANNNLTQVHRRSWSVGEPVLSVRSAELTLRIAAPAVGGASGGNSARMTATNSDTDRTLCAHNLHAHRISSRGRSQLSSGCVTPTPQGLQRRGSTSGRGGRHHQRRRHTNINRGPRRRRRRG